MTETVIVNRTPETDGLRRERLRLEQESHTETNLVAPIQDQVKTLVPVEADKVRYQVPENETGEYQLPGHVGDTIQVQTLTPGETPTAEPSLAEVAAMILAKRAPRDPDLAEFKDQVIRAFRHLGLDTRKFFGV